MLISFQIRAINISRKHKSKTLNHSPPLSFPLLWTISNLYFMDSYLIGLPVVSYRSLFINSLSLFLSFSLSLSLSLRNIKYFYSITLFFLFFNLFFFSWRSLHLQINSAARPLIITHKTSAYIYLYDHCYHLIPQKLHILCSEKAQSCSGNLNTHVSKVNFHVDL